jgi:ribulose-5-phosphate 4-epimerase/fuculose-1-phosphate aldolase
MTEERSLPPTQFQTFYVSREKSGSPQCEDMIHCSKKLQELQLIDQGKGSISIGFGNRILITGEDARLPTFTQEDIVEVVDYDPIKNIVLAAGKTKPHRETPIHWLIQHARHDVHAVVWLSNKKICEQIKNELPVTERVAPSGTIDLAKEILKALRDGKTILIKEEGILFVGITLKEIEHAATQIIQKVKQ